MKGAQNRTNIGFAICKNCSLNNMDVGQGSLLRLLEFVCVFALVIASNVIVVKVCPLLVRWSLKIRSLKNCCHYEGE